MLIFCQPARNCLILRYVVETIKINNITTESGSIKHMVKSVEGTKFKIFKIVIFDICTSIPTKSTMLITNMKEIFMISCQTKKLSRLILFQDRKK